MMCCQDSTWCDDDRCLLDVLKRDESYEPYKPVFMVLKELYDEERPCEPRKTWRMIPNYEDWDEEDWDEDDQQYDDSYSSSLSDVETLPDLLDDDYTDWEMSEYSESDQDSI